MAATNAANEDSAISAVGAFAINGRRNSDLAGMCGTVGFLNGLSCFSLRFSHQEL